jgi:hypothetical protein
MARLSRLHSMHASADSEDNNNLNSDHNSVSTEANYDNEVRAMLMGGLEPGETLEISAAVKRVLRPLGDPEGLPDWDRLGILPVR